MIKAIRAAHGLGHFRAGLHQDVLQQEIHREEEQVMRVQIPAYTDRWMMGDRYGDVVKVTRRRRVYAGVRAALLTEQRGAEVEIAHVKLDRSGKTVRVILDDCTVV